MAKKPAQSTEARIEDMATGEAAALGLFHEVARRVPAYQDFLRRHGVDAATVRTMADFRQLPLIDKANYLTQYPLHELTWDGSLEKLAMISVSSGSTGQPFFWPRGIEQDEEGAWFHEQLFRHIFEVEKRRTLLVICFSMGTWIAGSYTTASALKLIAEGLSMNVVTPGIEKAEAIKAIKHLAPYYEQIILAGYPPLTKDIVEEGRREGINWRSFRTRFLWAGESFSEEWRTFLLQKVGSADPYHDSASVFGSADAALLGHETPATVLARRLLARRPAQLKRLLGTTILPSLVQYYPERRFFEIVDGELVFTARAGIPLVRYNIHDLGGIVDYETFTNQLGPAWTEGLERYSIDAERWRLPFVYLGGRKDFTVTIYGVNIYPENVKAALIDPRLRSKVTGKFTMATKNRSDMDQYFEINVELARGQGVTPVLQALVEEVVLAKLMRLNAEYHRLHVAIGPKSLPQITLIPWGHPEYFKMGVKHRWVER
jgi:phenylacetate-CoA ligase